MTHRKTDARVVIYPSQCVEDDAPLRVGAALLEDGIQVRLGPVLLPRNKGVHRETPYMCPVFHRPAAHDVTHCGTDVDLIGLFITLTSDTRPRLGN
jgi:hypothetical protein